MSFKLNWDLSNFSYLIQDRNVERVFRGRLSVENPVDKKLSRRNVDSEDGVDVAVGYDVEQVAVEAQVAVVSVYLKARENKNY